MVDLSSGMYMMEVKDAYFPNFPKLRHPNHILRTASSTYTIGIPGGVRVFLANAYGVTHGHILLQGLLDSRWMGFTTSDLFRS